MDRTVSKTRWHRYYEMVLYYVDDVLAISATPIKTIEGINKVFKLKGDKAEVPDM